MIDVGTRHVTRTRFEENACRFARLHSGICKFASPGERNKRGCIWTRLSFRWRIVSRELMEFDANFVRLKCSAEEFYYRVSSVEPAVIIVCKRGVR